MAAKPEKNRNPEVPTWVVVVTYVICWGVGGFLALTTEPEDWRRLVVAAGFILFPISGASPLELARVLLPWGKR